MKLIAAIIVLVAGTAFGQWGRPSQSPAPDKVTYVAVMSVRVVDPGVSYAMVCGPDRPNCNTVYTTEFRYIPFTSAEDVTAYLNSTADTLVRLLTVKTAPVKKEETVTKVHHADTEDHIVHYRLP